MEEPEEVATATLQTTIHDQISPHVESLIECIESTQQKVLTMAGQAENFPLDNGTANLMANLVHAQMKDLHTVKHDLQDQVRKLDQHINQAIRNATKAEAAADKKANTLGLEIQKLKDEKAKLTQSIKEYDERTKAATATQTELEKILPQLEIAQQNAGAREKVVMDLQKTIETSNSNHQDTLANLQKQYSETVAILQQQKAEAEKKNTEWENEARLLKATVAGYERNAQDVAAYAESVAVKLAVDTETALMKDRHQMQQMALKNAHKVELDSLKESHMISMDRHERTIREERDKNDKLLQNISNLRNDRTRIEISSAAITRELESKRKDYTTLAQQLWNQYQQTFTETRFAEFETTVIKGLKQVSQDAKVNQARCDKVLQLGETWNEVLNETMASIGRDLIRSRHAHVDFLKSTTAKLEEYLSDTKLMLADGAFSEGRLTLTKRYLQIAHDAVDILRNDHHYRDQCDATVMQQVEEINRLSDQVEEQNEHINNLTKQLKDNEVKCAQTDQLQEQVRNLTSSQVGNTQLMINNYEQKLEKSSESIKQLTQDLAQKSKTLDDKETLFAALREDIVGHLTMIEILQKRVKELEDELDKHKADAIAAATRDRIQDERIQEELAQTKSELKDCNEHRADNDFKAKEYERLTNEMMRLQQEGQSSQRSGFQAPAATSTSRPSSIPQSSIGRSGSVRSGSRIARGTFPPYNLPTRGSQPPADILLGSLSPTLRRQQSTMTPSIRNTASIFGPLATDELTGAPESPRILTSTASSNIPTPTTPTQTSVPTSATPRHETLEFPRVGQAAVSTETAIEPSTTSLLGKRSVQDTPSYTPEHVKYATRTDRTRQGVSRDPSITETTDPTSEHPADEGLTFRDFAAAQQPHAGSSPQSVGPSTQSSERPRIPQQEGGERLMGDQSPDDELQLPESRPADESEFIFDLGDDTIYSDPPDSSRPTLRQPGQTDWRRPGVMGSDQKSIVFSQIVFPSNWDEDVNDDLIKVLTNPRRRYPIIHNDFLDAPLCMPSYVGHPSKSNLLQDDQDEPCDRCKEKERRCWGLKILDNTSEDPNPAKKNQKSARTAYVTDPAGHYWEAIYRPARGPGGDDDDDMTGTGDGATAA